MALDCQASGLVPADRLRQVIEALRQRGLEPVQANGADQRFVPAAPDAMERFYALLRHYSFRLFLRDVIKFRHELSITRLTRFVGTATAGRYLDDLVRLGLVTRTGETSRVAAGPVENFGATLEWFIATLLWRELSIPAVHGVRFRDTPHGGDYDVIGVVGGRLLYVEVKSSPPKHIDESEVDVFFQRLGDLKPDLAVFFVDTNLRMRDKVVVMFSHAARRALEGRPGLGSRAHRPVRLEREVFGLGPRLFIANSKHGAASNLRLCVRTYFDRRFDLGRFVSGP